MKSSPINFFPDKLVRALTKVEQKSGKVFFVSGGTIRDWLLGRQPIDLDITVKSGAVACCHELIKQLGGGTFVPLGRGDDEAARVVWRTNGIDFSAFRKGAQTIEEDLVLRDFSINAMALTFSGSLSSGFKEIIDPLGGREDLENGDLCTCPGTFVDDPLRMLRGYRFSAELGFSCDEHCSAEISRFAGLITQSSAERINYELNRIMMTGKAAEIYKEMASTGLLCQLFPELEDGLEMVQPGYHHEDVFHHNLLILQRVERIIAEPQKYFYKYRRSVTEYLQDDRKKNCLRWSAIFHDLGKPATHSSGTIKPDRIAFYNHDQVGKEIFLKIAARLRWSRVEMDVVGKLIELHMYPFHLCNVRRAGTVSRKACLRICKKADEDLPGLFVLAMADSLAGQGELKPENMELAQLFDEIQSANENLIQPTLTGKRLLTGRDLIKLFKLTPGPVFSEVFRELEVVMVEEKVRTREEAILWVEKYLHLTHERQ